jgi:ABC-type lipoprotein export system ATPase subunit
MDLFRGIHQQTGITALLVTHSAELGRYGTRSIQMAEGEIIS